MMTERWGDVSCGRLIWTVAAIGLCAKATLRSNWHTSHAPSLELEGREARKYQSYIGFGSQLGVRFHKLTSTRATAPPG